MAARPLPRTSSTTSEAKRERYMAAWPAEFPAPTTNTLRPVTDIASVAAAP